jgi:hypothetical protein
MELNSPELLEILACPKCKAKISVIENRLVCENCKLVYLVENGVPIMLKEEAKPL